MEGKEIGTCIECRFWHPLPENVTGECRRQPPSACILATKEGQRVDVYWPKTRASEWCGEWQKEAE